MQRQPRGHHGPPLLVGFLFLPAAAAGAAAHNSTPVPAGWVIFRADRST